MLLIVYVTASSLSDWLTHHSSPVVVTVLDVAMSSSLLFLHRFSSFTLRNLQQLSTQQPVVATSGLIAR